MRYSLGVDVGGTNIRIAIVDENGNIIDCIKERTNKIESVNTIIDQIVSLYNRIPKTYKFEGMGVGMPGPVRKDGTVLHLTNLGIIKSYNYKELLEEKINLPVYIGNDASVAGLAEAAVGAGKGYDIVQYLTLSTGIGGSLIINGKMIEGKNGMAQEVGDMIIKNGGRSTSITKAHGCIEGEASGTALTLKANEKGLNAAHAGEVFEMAANGNKEAIKLKEEWLDDMGAFIYSIYCYIEPDIFVLGGGMMKSKDYFLDELTKHIYSKYVVPSLKDSDCIKIVSAKYDQDCGIIGAAMLCF